MPFINNNQNINKKKVIVVDNASNSSGNIKVVAKYLSVFGIGAIGGYFAREFFGGKNQSLIFYGGELAGYLRKRFDTKPAKWKYSPRYYFIKFLDEILNYDNEKVRDDDLQRIVKYFVLSIVPFTENSSGNKIFGSIISSVINQVLENNDMGLISSGALRLMSANDSYALRSFLSITTDEQFLGDGIIGNQVCEKVFGYINKDNCGSYFQNMSSSFKDYFEKNFNGKFSDNENAKDNEDLVLSDKDDNLLTEKDEKNITNLENELKPDTLKKVVKFKGQTMARLFFELIFKYIIYQSFGGKK